MEISEEEAIKNLNDMSNIWFSSDCVDVNLKSLSNNLINMSEETQNSQQRAKQLKQKGRKSQSFGRPMSQQRYASVNNATKRHSLSINQDPSFMYDFQQQSHQQQQAQNQQNPKGLNNSVNCSLSQLSSSFDPNGNNNTIYQINNCMQGSKITNRVLSTGKTSEFLSLMTPGFQQNKKEHYETLYKLREKERLNREIQQDLVLYGNNSQQETIVQSVNKLTISASTCKNEDILYSKEQGNGEEQQNTQTQQSRISTNLQVNNNALNSSYSNFYPQENNHIKQSNNSINCFQRVFDKIASQQNQQPINSQYTTIQTSNNSNDQVANQQQYGYLNQNNANINNHHQLHHTSYKANELIENSPQFLIKLKSRFSRAASCFRKKTPIKNSVNNINSNIIITPQGKESVVGTILNPKNMYSRNQTNHQEQQVQYSSSNSALQMLQIVPAPLSAINHKAQKQRKITISSESEAEDHLNQFSEMDKKLEELSEEGQGDKKGEQSTDANCCTSYQQIEKQNIESQDEENRESGQQYIPLQNNNINYSFLIYNDDDCSPITQSNKQIESNTQRQHYQSSNSRIKPNVQQYEAIKPNLYYIHSSSENKTQKIESLLGQMQVMGHKIRKNSVGKQQQNKENLYSERSSNRQQLSLSLYGEKSFKKDDNVSKNNQQQTVIINHPLGQQSQNLINSQNNQVIFTERQYSTIKNSSRVQSAAKGRNTNQNHSNNNSYSQITQINASNVNFNNNNQSNLKQKSSIIKCAMKNENINLAQQNNIQNAHLSKYSNTQFQPQAFRLDSKQMQTRTFAFNENQNKISLQQNHITKIFDDQALCQKVNNLLSIEMSNKSLQITDQVNQIKGKIDFQQQQNCNQSEIKVISNQKTKRNVYAGRDRQKSVDLSYNTTQNQQDQQRKLHKKKEKNDTEMINLSAKLNQQISKDSSILKTPRYLTNNPSR